MFTFPFKLRPNHRLQRTLLGQARATVQAPHDSYPHGDYYLAEERGDRLAWCVPEPLSPSQTGSALQVSPVLGDGQLRAVVRLAREATGTRLGWGLECGRGISLVVGVRLWEWREVGSTGGEAD